MNQKQRHFKKTESDFVSDHVREGQRAFEPRYVAMPCDECGGTGIDPGNLREFEPEECPVCHGAKTQEVQRDYLTEAFRIAAGESAAAPEREHLQAVIDYSRAVSEAAMGPLFAAQVTSILLPEVA